MNEDMGVRLTRSVRLLLLAACVAIVASCATGPAGHPKYRRRTVIVGMEPAEAEKLKRVAEVAEQRAATLQADLQRLQKRYARLREQYKRAGDLYGAEDRARAAALERDVERLRADLAQAEEAFISMESGLRGVYTRAEAISALAEARVRVERAKRKAPNDDASLAEARTKLEDSERQIKAQAYVAAVFFASRARRLADALIAAPPAAAR
jgi:DNA repair exonuclease SbcCD ATPase subunit